MRVLHAKVQTKDRLLLFEDRLIGQPKIPDIAKIHRHWLGAVYPWAGEYRQVNVSKGGLMFAAAAQVPRLMAEFRTAEDVAALTRSNAARRLGSRSHGLRFSNESFMNRSACAASRTRTQ